MRKGKLRKERNEFIEMLKGINREKNKFSISFGLVLVIIGICLFFTDCNNNLLIGVSISSFIFSITSCFCSEKSIFNFLPLLVLMVFMVFPDQLEKIPYIRVLLDPRFNNAIVFVSFGFSFIFNYLVDIKKDVDEKFKVMENTNRHLTFAVKRAEFCMVTKKEILKILTLLSNKKYVDVYDSLENLNEYVSRENLIVGVTTNLLDKGFDKKVDVFDIDDIESAIYASNKCNVDKFLKR